MAMRSHLSRKTSESNSASQSLLRSRGFAPQPKPDKHPSLADIQTQLEHTQRFGHSLTKINFDPHKNAPPIVQPKLAIGQPGDKYEQEADRVAQQVVQQLNAPKLGRSPYKLMDASADLENSINRVRGGGQALVSHDLTHVVQQHQGGIGKTVQKNGEALVQRLVWYMKHGRDPKLDNDAKAIEKKFGGPTIDSVQGLVDVEFKSGDTIHVVAHLNKGTMGKAPPKMLADSMNKFLRPEVNNITIDLHGCFAANPKALGEDADKLWMSYAGQFKTALDNFKDPDRSGIQVVASLGAEYTSTEGETRLRQGHLSHKDYDDKVRTEIGRRSKKGESIKVQELAQQISDNLIESKDSDVFYGENKGRLLFKNFKKDEIKPLVGRFGEDDFNDPDSYTVQ